MKQLNPKLESMPSTAKAIHTQTSSLTLALPADCRLSKRCNDPRISFRTNTVKGMKYYGFWESSRPIPPKRKVKCQICGEKVKLAYPIDCLLRNMWWINSVYFCFKHTVDDLEDWCNKHLARGEPTSCIDESIFTEYQELKP